MTTILIRSRYSFLRSLMQGDDFLTAASQAPCALTVPPPQGLLRRSRLITEKRNEVALLKSHKGDDCGVSTEITQGRVEGPSTLSPNKLNVGDSA